MDLFVQGQGSIRLGPADFVSQGGEGAVYARGDRAFKIYADPARMIPASKIQELGALKQPRIIRPEALLLDSRNRPVGYAMRRVRDAAPLCQLFPRAFRERNGVTPDAIVRLVRSLQDGVKHVHEQGILIVDLNEMNFLVGAALQEVFFIDVDSYQTPGFPATALMDSVRDRHASRFSENTDWFSFGILSFQMFIGIHPYRGKHPDLLDLDARMRRNVSVLNPEVSVPATCYPLDVIPRSYFEWYRAIFEEGKRLPPPSDLRPVVTLAPAAAGKPDSDALRLREIARFPGEILCLVPAGGSFAVLTTEGLYFHGKRHSVPADARLALTPRMNHVVAAWIRNGAVELYSVTEGAPLADAIRGEALTTCSGRIYVKQGDCLSELQFAELPAGTRAVPRPVGNAMEHGTRVFDGVAIQSLPGALYASLFPAAGACRTVRLPELDGCRVVEARCENGVLMVLALRGGEYERCVFRFDERHAGYDVRGVPDVPCASLNFVVLDTGVCIHLNEQEELELFSNRPGSRQARTLADPALPGARLFKSGTRLLLARDGILYEAKLVA